jgi:hypothetical protein
MKNTLSIAVRTTIQVRVEAYKKVMSSMRVGHLLDLCHLLKVNIKVKEIITEVTGQA